MLKPSPNPHQTFIADAHATAHALRVELAYAKSAREAEHVQRAAEAARDALDLVAVDASVKVDRLMEGS